MFGCDELIQVVVKPEFLQPSEASGKFRDGELKKAETVYLRFV